MDAVEIALKDGNGPLPLYLDLDMSLPQLEMFAGAVLVSICVLMSPWVSQSLMFLLYGGSFSLLFSPRSSSPFER